ncbi:MAG: hypothetical protein JSV65_13250 [Armatimonadota bacterium]|nr:MAG: hypothetical protein JSV65_13250 [Armatimonadota bacterium]
MHAMIRRLDEIGMPVFGRTLQRAVELWGRVFPVLQRTWNSGPRRRYISWTRFRDKRLTLKGFLSFDRNARIRTYLYLAVAAAYLGSAFGSPSIVSLVRIACRAIEMAGLPGTVYSVMMYEKAMQVDALRDSLLAHYDADRNGKLEPGQARALTLATGLTAQDLTVSCAEGDFDRLLKAAHAQHVLPKTITREIEKPYDLKPDALLRALRHGNYEKGQAAYERQRAALWKEIEPDLTYRWGKPRDYLEWATWRTGIQRFYDTARQVSREAAYYVAHPQATYRSLTTR